MYKVCFVDDETINYQLFEKMVPWEEKGFQIAGTAADGLEALQMYERVQPDLIFMDIQLPLMDGLECVRCIREENPDVQIVIVSAYSDFSYAQKAIRYGVQDFLLKPVSRMMLNQQVDKIKNTLDNRLRPEKSRDLYSNPYTDEMNQFFACISQNLDGRQPPLKNLAKMKTVYHLVLHPLSGGEEGAAKIKELTAELAMLPAVSAGLSMIYILSASSLYFGYGNDAPDEPDLSAVIEFFRENEYAAEIYLWKCKEESELPYDFLTRSYSLENYGFYERCGRVYELSEYPFCDTELDTAPLDGLIVAALAENTTEQLMEYIDRQFLTARSEMVSPRLLKNFVLDVLVKIKFCLKKFAPEESFFLMRNLRMEKIYNTVGCDALKGFLTRRIEEAFAELDSRILQAGKGEHVVFRANSFAELKFSDPGFSVQMAADFIGISKNYFTSLYKEKAGVGYWDYVTQLRMQKAKELLATTEDTIGTVAREIGYESEYHFSRKFKEYTGQSPNRYRKQS